MKLRNEVLVGLVVLVGMIILVIAAFWLSGKPWGAEEAQISAVFRDVGELKEGNPVVYHGVAVGRVSAIDLSPAGTSVLVRMDVRSEVQLPPDAVVVLAPASLFGDWQAQLTTRSAQPTLVFTEPTVPGLLPGAALPDISQLTAVAARIAADIETLSDRIEVAFTEETALDIRRTVENVQDISEQLNGFVDAQTRTLDQLAGNALSASKNIEQTTARVDRVATQLENAVSSGEIEAILANARQASENLQQLSAQLENATGGIPGLVAQADSTMASIRTIAQRASGLMATLEPQVAEVGPTLVEARQAITNLNQVLASVEQSEGTLGRLIEDPALYEEMQRSLTQLRRLLADLQQNPGRYIGELQVF